MQKKGGKYGIDAHAGIHQGIYSTIGGSCSNNGCIGGTTNKENRQISTSSYTLNKKAGMNKNVYLLQPQEALKGGGAREGAGVPHTYRSNPITGEQINNFITQEEFEGNKQIGGKKVSRKSKKMRKSKKSRKSRKVSRKSRKSRKVSRKSRKVSRKSKKMRKSRKYKGGTQNTHRPYLPIAHSNMKDFIHSENSENSQNTLFFQLSEPIEK
jgi:hypothetical protein